jgi:hypothetical protein
LEYFYEVLEISDRLINCSALFGGVDGVEYFATRTLRAAPAGAVRWLGAIAAPFRPLERPVSAAMCHQVRGFENRRTGNGTRGSNPFSSAEKSRAFATGQLDDFRGG